MTKTISRGSVAACLLASGLVLGGAAGEARALTPKMPHGVAAKMGAMGAGALNQGRHAAAGLLRHGMGIGAAALAGGLAIDALVPRPGPDCSIAERPAVDDWGNTYYERIRVCE